MYGARQDAGADQMSALIIGTLDLDGDCLYTTSEGIRYPVLFPYGTSWDATSSTVVLPDGSAIEVGGEVYGGGGYVQPNTIDLFANNTAVLERAKRCAEGPYFEVAVMQATVRSGTS